MILRTKNMILTNNAVSLIYKNIEVRSCNFAFLSSNTSFEILSNSYNLYNRLIFINGIKYYRTSHKKYIKRAINTLNKQVE